MYTMTFVTKCEATCLVTFEDVCNAVIHLETEGLSKENSNDICKVIVHSEIKGV